MKRIPFALFTLFSLLLILGLTGCSRTIDDVATWKAKGNIEKLIKALADLKVEVRVAAAEALGELKAEPAVDSLAALYNDSEETVVLSAVNALAAIGSETTTTPMIAALKLDYPEARIKAAIALGQLKATSAVQPLGEALDDREESVRLAAASSLGQTGEEAGSEALVGKLNADSTDLRLACVEALALTGGDTAVKGLMGSLNDSNADVAKAAITSLVQLGGTSTPATLEGLKNDNPKIRSGSIAVLRGQKAIPLTGNNVIWYQLARASVDKKDGIDLGLVKTLVKIGDEAIDTLLEAAAHNVPDFREHASLALERNGNAAVAKAKAAANANASSSAKAWFKSRNSWSGAPSWRIDLWSAVASLNPDFNLDQAKAADLQTQGRTAFNVIIAPDFKLTRAYVPLLINLLGDQTQPPPLQPDYDADGIPVVKKAVDRFRGEANQQMAKEKLATTKYFPTLPLIVAIEDSNELIAGHAAQILGEQEEKRALKPLMNVVAKKIKAGEQLTTSPFYTALQKMEAPESEPLLLKIRPSAERAMHVFEHKYTGVRPIGAETTDETGHYTQPLTFRLGYIDNGRVGKLMVTFSKDGAGDWKPTPPLPDTLTAQ
ncbi:MAG: HEAT repeat domain-containing protein [Pontiella sp.]